MSSYFWLSSPITQFIDINISRSDFWHKVERLLGFVFFFSFFNFFLLYNTVLVLPYIDMNLPQVYMSSQPWTPLPPLSPYHLSGSSQGTSPKHPVSCIEPRLAIRFLHDSIHVSMPFSQIILPSPSPSESKSLFFTSVSLAVSHTGLSLPFFHSNQRKGTQWVCTMRCIQCADEALISATFWAFTCIISVYFWTTK